MASEAQGTESVDGTKLAELTAQIVAAYVTNNSIAPSDVPDMIRAVAASLQPGRAVPEASRAAPAVPVRKSITPDHLVCLVCGKHQRTLKRHLETAHGMDPAQYREQFGLERSYPMVAPAYSASRSEMAKQLGLGRKGAQTRAGRGGGARRGRAQKQAGAD